MTRCATLILFPQSGPRFPHRVSTLVYKSDGQANSDNSSEFKIAELRHRSDNLRTLQEVLMDMTYWHNQNS